MSSDPAHPRASVPSDKGSTSADSRPNVTHSQGVWALLVFGALAGLLLADLAADSAGTSLRHLVLEIAATILAVAAAANVWLRWVRTRRALEDQVDDLGVRLRAANRAAEQWREEAKSALEGLGAAIERQCDRWALTDAERDVAVLLLKGLSMKEIADARGTTERTARQQALAVYRKADLGGRAELAAFFLEDLLLPSKRADEKA